jgi:hypothetical protein
MAQQLGPVEIVCDAPPYGIVRACCRVGFGSPADVRWERLHEHLRAQEKRGSLLSLRTWKAFFRRGPKPRACRCGADLPEMALYQFTTVWGKRTGYLLGQCRRCRTIFWEEA